MKRGLLVWSVVALGLAGVASGAVQRGETDIALSGTWFTENADNDGLDFDGLFLSGGLGYFFSDHFEAEIAALGIWTTGNPTTPFLNKQDDTFYAVGVKGKWHFGPAHLWVPYLGAQFFWGHYERDAVGTDFDADFDGILWGPLAGLRFELNKTNDFFVEYQYHIWAGDVSDTDTKNSPGWEDGHLVTLGLIHQLR